jgi:hypothetical protein
MRREGKERREGRRTEWIGVKDEEGSLDGYGDGGVGRDCRFLVGISGLW